MIANILLLLAANIMLPLLPVPPELLLTYPVYQYFTAEPTIYNDMNLQRHYNPDELKKAFRQSLKKFHPDRGGTAEHFAMIKAAKQIMQHQPNYYDLYNLTNIDLKRHQNIEQAASMKQLLFQFQNLLFYFIALLYFIAFTIDERSRGLRKILLPLTIISCAYEFYLQAYPQTVTMFDVLDGEMPLFVQSKFIKLIFVVFTAVLRTKRAKSKDEEIILLEQIQKLPPISQYQLTNDSSRQQKPNQSQQSSIEIKELYINKLTRLLQIYVEKVKKQQQTQKSWGAKIKNWISKGVSFLIFGAMIYGLVVANFGGKQSFDPSSKQQF